MAKLVEDFQRLPDPVSQRDVVRSTYSWTLQYAKSHSGTDPSNSDDTEFVLGSEAMLQPITIPCKKSFLQLEAIGTSPYMIGLFCQAFVGEQGKRLLDLDRGNQGQSVTSGGVVPSLDCRRSAHDSVPTGVPTDDFADLPIKRVTRPVLLVCRDASLQNAMMSQAMLLGLGISVTFPDDSSDPLYTPLRNAAGQSDARTDAKICGGKDCKALSPDLSVCTGCRLAFYCSVAHQKEDWVLHGPLCKQAKRWRKVHDEYEKRGKKRPRFFVTQVAPGILVETGDRYEG